MNLGKIHPVIIFIVAAALLLVLLGLTALLGEPSPFDGELNPVGPDSFMRMMRIETWWQSGEWYSALSSRSNVPYGEALHWTRPLDLLVMVPTLLFSLFMSFKDALLVGGFIIGPLLGVAFLGLLVWGQGDWKSAGRRPAVSMILLAVLAISAPELRGYFIPMRVDHHSLLLVCFITIVVTLLRMADNTHLRPRLAWVAGVAAGLAMWTSVESLISVLIGAGALGLLWLVYGGAWLGLIGRFLWGTTGILALGLLAERPPGDYFTVITYDQPSIVHLSALGAAALTWTVLTWLRPRLAAGIKGRWVVAVAGIAVPVVIQGAMFPDFFQSPFGAAMDPRLDAIWLSQVSELQTLFKGDARTIAKALVFIGPGAIALLWAIVAWRRGAGAERTRALVLFVALGVTIPLAFYQVRWSSYLGAVSVLPWLWVMMDAWQGAGRLRAWGRLIPMRTPAFLGVYTAPYVLAVIAFAFVDTKSGRPPPTPCQWEIISPSLAALSPGPLNIISFIHQGPEILWRTHHNVVATPYHRNTAGILDSHTFFTTDNANTARAIAERRGIDLVVICRDSVETRNFASLGEDVFIRSLNGGAIPDWLEETHLNGDADFRVFKVQ